MSDVTGILDNIWNNRGLSNKNILFKIFQILTLKLNAPLPNFSFSFTKIGLNLEREAISYLTNRQLINV